MNTIDLGSWIIGDGALEVRQKSNGFKTLAGRFLYNKVATVRDRGRRRKERIGPNAFAYSITAWKQLQAQIDAIVEESARQTRATTGTLEELIQARDRANVHILVGHDFGKPLGDLTSGTARMESNDEALTFEVDLPTPDDRPTWVTDAIASVAAGLMTGLSPGFSIPPKSVVPNSESFTPEPGNPEVLIREILDARLVEMSLVTRPAYSESTVDLRSLSVTRPNRMRVWL